MNFFRTLRVAIRALFRNKTRSFLTTLGIIIGVAAVIAMVAIGEGAKAQVEQAFSAMGANLLIVLPGSTTSGGARGGSGSQPTLTWTDLKAIRDEISTVRYAAAFLRSNAQIASEDQNWTTSISGTSPEYFEIRSWAPSNGTIFSQSDVEGGSKVVVLGQTVAEKLFGPNADPIGHAVRIKNTPYQVIGVLTKKGQSGVGQDYDDAAFIPQTTFAAKVQGGLQKYLNGQIYVSASSEENTNRALSQITNLLRDRHHIAQGADDDFSIRNMAEMANSREESTKTMTMLLASVAAVSLLVGGIGIMNIMLVSVTERTREIGLRMAVGAKPRHILAQFLVEALTLSIAGGIIGVLLGVGGGQYLSQKFGWPVLIRVDVILVAVGFSAAVGVVFGLYPARKASRLDPIEALRYE
jgi:putative ABC transport system permease protein